MPTIDLLALAKLQFFITCMCYSQHLGAHGKHGDGSQERHREPLQGRETDVDERVGDVRCVELVYGAPRSGRLAVRVFRPQLCESAHRGALDIYS